MSLHRLFIAAASADATLTSASACVLGTPSGTTGEAHEPPRMFGQGAPFAVSDLPVGALHRDLKFNWHTLAKTACHSSTGTDPRVACPFDLDDRSTPFSIGSMLVLVPDSSGDPPATATALEPWRRHRLDPRRCWTLILNQSG